MKNLISNREAMAAHLTLHGWHAVKNLTGFEDWIYRIVNPELNGGVVLSSRAGATAVWRSSATRYKDHIPFAEIPKSVWELLIKRAIGLNLVEGIDGKEICAFTGRWEIESGA